MLQAGLHVALLPAGSLSCNEHCCLGLHAVHGCTTALIDRLLCSYTDDTTPELLECGPHKQAVLTVPCTYHSTACPPHRAGGTPPLWAEVHQ